MNDTVSHSSGNRRPSRQIHRRPGQRQKIGRDRPAQPLAPPAGPRRTSAHEIMPNNIIMIGPTGVGKTEIARRLADLAARPFHQGRSVEIHRGRLCWPRCRIDGPRSRRYRREHGQDRKMDRASRPTPKRHTVEHLLDLLLMPTPREVDHVTRPRISAGRVGSSKTREKLRTVARSRARSTTARWRSTRRRTSSRWWRFSRRWGWKSWGSTSRRCSPG